VTCANFDITAFNWVKSQRSFEFNDIYREQEGMFITMDEFKVVSMVQTSKSLLYIIALYGTLAWYFDNIYEHNRGVP